MNDLNRNALSIFGYLFAALLIAFTGSQTYQLLFAVSQSQITAAIGLVLFEGGMLYWWLVFRREATGLPQMAVSLLMFIASLGLVAAAVAVKLDAVPADLLGSSTPARIITLAALLNLIAKLAFPLLAPEQFTAITEKAHEGRILAKTYARFETKIDDIAEEVADQMAEEWTIRTRRRTLDDWQGRLNSTHPEPSLNGSQPVRFQATSRD